MVTWARIENELQDDLHRSGRTLKSYEWNCGNQIFINDLITPYGDARNVIKEMTLNVFPNAKMATSIRRNNDGSIRRINKWSSR